MSWNEQIVSRLKNSLVDSDSQRIPEPPNWRCIMGFSIHNFIIHTVLVQPWHLRGLDLKCFTWAWQANNEQHGYKQLNKVLPAYFFVSNIQKQYAIFFFSFSFFFVCREVFSFWCYIHLKSWLVCQPLSFSRHIFLTCLSRNSTGGISHINDGFIPWTPEGLENIINVLVCTFTSYSHKPKLFHLEGLF